MILVASSFLGRGEGVLKPQGPNDSSGECKGTEMGLLPKEWRVARLGSVVTEPASYGLNAPSVPRNGSLPTYIRITDIGSDGRFAPRPPVSVDDPRSHEFLLSPGDLVFARTGASVGKSYLYNRDDGPLVFAGFLIRVTPDRRRLLPEYLAQYAHSAWYWRWVTDTSARSGQPGINAREYGALRIPLPPLLEQRRIAAFLATWDRAIDLAARRLAAVRVRRRGLVQTLLGVGCDHDRADGRAWTPVRLREVLSESVYRSRGGDDVYSVSVSRGLVNQIEYLGRSFAAADTSHYSRVMPGDIVYTRSPTGEFPLGVIKQSTVPHPVIVSPLYGVYTPKSLELGVIIAAIFESPIAVRNYLRPLVHKGAKNTIAVTNRRFLEGRLTLPTYADEERRAAAALRASDRDIRATERLITHLRAQKRSLLEQLFTGQLRAPPRRDADGAIAPTTLASDGDPVSTPTPPPQ